MSIRLATIRLARLGLLQTLYSNRIELHLQNKFDENPMFEAADSVQQIKFEELNSLPDNG